MSAYIIVQATVHDPEAYERYKALTPASIERYGGRFLVRGGNPACLEGTMAAERLVILEFPDRDTAQQWYTSPEYEAAKDLRQGAATMTFTLVDGVPAQA